MLHFLYIINFFGGAGIKKVGNRRIALSTLQTGTHPSVTSQSHPSGG